MRITSRAVLVGVALAGLLGTRDAAGQLGFSWAPQNPSIGELVLFQISGASGLESATWDFGGEGCSSYTRVTTCTPQFTNCLTQTFRYASAGEKTVSLTVVSGGATLGPVTQTLRVREEGSCGGGCSLALDPSSAPFSAGGGTGAVVIDASAANCSWTASSSADWLHLTGHTNGVGDGIVTYAVDPNAGASRSGTLSIGGGSAAVEQRGTPQGGAAVAVTPPNTAVDTAFTLAADRDGNRLVAWAQPRDKAAAPRKGGSKTAVPGLFLRRFDSSDSPLGDTVEVTTTGGDSNCRPTAAVDGDGGFIVGWEKRGSDPGVYGRLFDPDGAPRGDPFRASRSGGQVPEAPSVSSGRSGRMAMTWSRGGGLYLRAFAADGSPESDETRVDASSGLALSPPSVACDAAARCLVVWHELTDPTGNGVVLGRTFGPTGTPTSPVLVLAGDPEASATDPSVGVDALGNAVVAWAEVSAETDGRDIVARRFGPDGWPAGGRFRVNLGTPGDQLRPAVSVNSAGDFAMAWAEAPESGVVQQPGTGVFARLFGSGGAPLTADFEVATADDLLAPVEPAVALGDDLTVTVAWAMVNAEGGGRGVVLRTFRPDEAPRREAFLPGVAHLAGYNDTQWRTDAEVCNPGADAVTYELAFLAADRANPSPPAVPFELGPGRCRRHEDLVLGDFELDPASGALRVVSSGEGVLVSARTFNTAPAGTYGSFNLAAPVQDAVEHGEKTTFIHLSESADLDVGFRTNLILFNTTQSPLTVEVALRRSDGTLLGTPAFELLPGDYRQVNRVFREVTVSEVQDGFATLTTSTPEGAFLAVASFVDNRTGDGVSLPGLSDRGHESTWFLPGVAHLPGYNGTRWRTSLEVCSTASSALTYELAFLEERQENLTPLVASFVVGPGRCARHDDVVRSAFGVDEGSGAIRVTAPVPHLLAVARTYNDTLDGTFGSVNRAHTLGETVGIEERGLLMHLSHSADLSRGFRTNLVLVNPTPAEVDLTVDLYRADGTLLGTLAGALRAFEHRQLNRVFESVTTGNVEDGYAVVSTPTPGGALLAIASVVDNRSGDGVTVPCLKLR